MTPILMCTIWPMDMLHPRRDNHFVDSLLMNYCKGQLNRRLQLIAQRVFWPQCSHRILESFGTNIGYCYFGACGEI